MLINITNDSAILTITAPVTITLVNIGDQALVLENTLDGEQLVNASITLISISIAETEQFNDAN